MADAPDLRPAPLRSRREAAIQLLCAEFAQDNLALDEFERRLDLAHRATSLEEIDALVADLRPVVTSAEVAAAPAPVAALPSTDVRATQFLLAIMGGVERRGRWTPARETSVLAIMGGAQLDFREASLPPGVTEVNVACLMGGVEVIVPPGLAVDTDGVAIMGGFVHLNRDSATPGPEAPVLRIRGFALMGGVEITVRQAGETAKQARQREKRLRRGDA